MPEIKCPNCQTIFKIDESSYESILNQVKTTEFEKELDNRLKLKDEELAMKIKLLKEELSRDYESKLNNKDLEIKTLTDEVKLIKSENSLNLKDALTKKDNEIANLKNDLSLEKKSSELKEMSLKESYENKLKDKDEQIAYYKDFKARQSTKMIGESLEQHCLLEFNRLRPLFKNAYFAKDNDCKTGSKGDFIFRDYDDDNNEIVSIMFEMKNEADTTQTKHKNEDFLKELDKDRREKNCEYAVLVSLLEMDNDYYNDGICDVSHIFDKMYVIRPQFFIPLITLIRNLSLKALDYKKDLELMRLENIDISRFEENMNNFKESFNRNYRLASERFQKAILEIDKTIEHLQKTKEHLLKTDDNLRIANNKADELTIKKITYNNKTMQKMFKDLKEVKNN